MAFELVSTAALHQQRTAFDNMIRHAAEVRGRSVDGGGHLVVGARAPLQHGGGQVVPGGIRTASLLGLRVMWDEAGQKLRPLLHHLHKDDLCTVKPGAQTVLQVMSVCAELFAVCSMEDLASGDYVSVQRWEAWLAPPRILANTSTDFVLEGLVNSMPFPVDDPSRRDAVLASTDCFLLVLICDSASSNIKSLRWFAAQARLAGPKFLFFPEVRALRGGGGRLNRFPEQAAPPNIGLDGTRSVLRTRTNPPV